jgi:hypothetical protein
MRFRATRVLAVLGVSAAILMAGAAHALANGDAAAICPAGQVALSVHWADAQDALFCSVADGLQSLPMSGTIVGLVVRGSDDSITTVDVAPASNAVVTDTRTTTSSKSISSSSSTSCIDGKCTSVSNQTVCVDGTCSSQP